MKRNQWRNALIGGLSFALFSAIVYVVTTSATTSVFLGVVSSVIGLASGRIVDTMAGLILGKDEPDLQLEPLNISPQTPFTRSQFINMAWSSGTVRAEDGKTTSDIKQNQLNARFGIIRFHNTGSDAVECRVELRYLSKIANSNQTIWLEGGYLNWVSLSKRHRIVELKQLNVFDLNRLLENPVENILRGETKELQVCFTVEGGTVVILCSDMNRLTMPLVMPFGTAFEIEITVTAQKFYPPIKKHFEIIADSKSITFSELELSSSAGTSHST